MIPEPAPRPRLVPGPRPVPDPPPEPLAGRERLFPEAYRSTLAGGVRRLLPGLKRWLLALAAVAVLLLLLSIPVWRAATSELRAAVERSLARPPAAAAGEPAGTP